MIKDLKELSEELSIIRKAIVLNDSISKTVSTLEESAYYDFKTEIQMNIYCKKRDRLYDKLEIFYKGNLKKIDEFIDENKIVKDGILIFDYYLN